MDIQRDDSSTVMKELYAQFPQEMERTIVKSGVELIYLPISEVINRLNKVLGVDGWSFEIISVHRDAVDQDELVAHVSLTADIAGKRIIKHGFGGSSVKRAKQSGKPIDLGNDFKGAVSDALKKAAQQLGVGLYLARSTDAMDAEEAILVESAQESQSTAQPADDEKSVRWSAFIDVTKSMSSEEKEQLNSFWASHSGNKPKPTKDKISMEDLEALVAEAVRIKFAGKYVDEQGK